MPRKPKSPPTLAQVAIGNAGFRQAILAFEFMMGWGMCSASLGREPGMDEYAEMLDHDRATSYRHRSAFLKAFPGEENPTRLIRATGQEQDYKDRVKALDDLASTYKGMKATLFSIGSATYAAP